jgi:Immunity protein 49
MTQQSLINVLTQLGIPRNTYDFDVKTPDIDLMGQIDGIWSLYFIEKGNISITKQFSSEEELYDYYLADAYKQQEQRQKTQSMTDADVDDVFAKLEQSKEEKSKEEQKKTDDTEKQGNWRDRLIPWHFADDYFDETIQWSKKTVENSKKIVEKLKSKERISQNSDFVRQLANEALKTAIVGFIADFGWENVFEYMRLAAYTGTQLCELYALVPLGETYQLDIGTGDYIEIVHTQIDAQGLPSYFQRAMYCAFICRETALLQRLAALPLNIIERPAADTPTHLHLDLAAFQAFWLSQTIKADQLSADAFGSIIKGLDELEQEKRPFTWREIYHRDVTTYNSELFRLAILPNTTSQEFNIKLTDSMLAFRKCMKENENLFDDWHYFINLGALAWTSLAYDQGIKIDTISDYIPGFLYEGKFAKHKIKVSK